MKARRLFYIVLLVLLAMPATADVAIKLKSGQTVTGTIVFQNDEVVVVKSAEGQRFQYPMSEVADIAETETVKEEEEKPRDDGQTKRVGFSLHLSGGGGIVPDCPAGGHFGATVYIGASNLFDKQVFVGGGVGADLFFMPAASQASAKAAAGTYIFIPLQVRFSAPFMQTKHAPAAGCSVGYGFCTRGIERGGVSASADLGWRCRFSQKSALFAGLTAGVQQTKIDITETIDNADYTTASVRCLWKVGAKIALQF